MKATAWDSGFATISSPTTGPGPRTRLKTPGGKSASTKHSASSVEHQAVLGAGTQTTAVAGRERRRHDLGRHRVRPVPGGDAGDDAAGAADQQRAAVGGRGDTDRALDADAVLGGEAEQGDQLVDLVGALGQRLALVEGAGADQLGALGLDESATRCSFADRSNGEAVRQAQARVRERPGGRPGRPARSPSGRLPDRLAGGRAGRLDRGSGPGVAPCRRRRTSARSRACRSRRQSRPWSTGSRTVLRRRDSDEHRPPLEITWWQPTSAGVRGACRLLDRPHRIGCRATADLM